jgi:hypothetical protein
VDIIKAIQTQIKGLKAFEDGIIKTMQTTIRDNDVIIHELVSEEQLFEKGINKFEVKISDYQPYTPVTVEFKRIKSQPSNRVTLRDTGAFHESFYVNITSTYFEVLARDPKTGDLIKKYGSEILGLTDENINEILINYILPDLITFRKKTVGL